MRGLGRVVANLGAQVEGTKMALAAYAQMIVAPKMEAWAKPNAPWNDISGAAREGLKGGTIIKGNKIIIYIAHTVDYGVYLELAHDKKYEILDPTIDHFKAEVFRDYQRIMGMPC